MWSPLWSHPHAMSQWDPKSGWAEYLTSHTGEILYLLLHELNIFEVWVFSSSSARPNCNELNKRLANIAVSHEYEGGGSCLTFMRINTIREWQIIMITHYSHSIHFSGKLGTYGYIVVKQKSCLGSMSIPLCFIFKLLSGGKNIEKMSHNFLIYKNTTLKHKLKQNTQICKPCEMHIYFQRWY